MHEPTMEEILQLKGMEDVLAELLDPNYANRQHGSRSTRSLKCDGPLCRLAERDRSRRRNKNRALRDGREYEPGRREYDRDDLMYAIIAWHKVEIVQRRIMEEEAS